MRRCQYIYEYMVLSSIYQMRIPLELRISWEVQSAQNKNLTSNYIIYIIHSTMYVLKHTFGFECTGRKRLTTSSRHACTFLFVFFNINARRIYNIICFSSRETIESCPDSSVIHVYFVHSRGNLQLNEIVCIVFVQRHKDLVKNFRNMTMTVLKGVA